ncbi:hypothetical protein TNIN_153101 [Trichonephila inaurata madagascariensis]|uniref:Uncharacterized protein n=1 Tax=Trichonephila inaurata madagascariensis TaxID=2747483 RepID=A0A8X7BTV2_9ARAC|nr:hypothetical protein TNIN_153101 [Trichonephila inaurata madagascariensis]
MQNKITITQKFLEKGHKQMECDSMHSVIERALRHTQKINVPADYAYLDKEACKIIPYEVEYLYTTSSKIFRQHCLLTSLSVPEKKVQGWQSGPLPRASNWL